MSFERAEKVIQKKGKEPQVCLQFTGKREDILNLIEYIVMSFTNDKKLSNEEKIMFEKDLSLRLLNCISDFTAFEKEGSFDNWIDNVILALDIAENMQINRLEDMN